MKHSVWQSIQRLDEKILDLVQGRLVKFRLRPVMSFFSHPPYWRQMAVVVILAAISLGSPQTRWQIGFLILALLLSEHTCNLLKALVKRVRPDGDRPTGNFWERLGHYSFPSSHAANMFCTAVLSFHYWTYLGLFFYLWASLVALSRIYLKNHYPSDVLTGGIIGAGYGFLFTKLFP